MRTNLEMSWVASPSRSAVLGCTFSESFRSKLSVEGVEPEEYSKRKLRSPKVICKGG